MVGHNGQLLHNIPWTIPTLGPNSEVPPFLSNLRSLGVPTLHLSAMLVLLRPLRSEVTCSLALVALPPLSLPLGLSILVGLLGLVLLTKKLLFRLPIEMVALIGMLLTLNILLPEASRPLAVHKLPLTPVLQQRRQVTSR